MKKAESVATHSEYSSGNSADRMLLKGIRGAFFDCVDDPFVADGCGRYIPDGLLVISGGRIHDFGDYLVLRDRYPEVEITHYPNQLITPGFIDIHTHYPQTEMIAAYGEQLLTWLDKYTFPTEAKFQDKEYARRIAAFFLDELLRNGTTTAVVLTTIFAESVTVFFEEAQRRNMRMIAGQVLMSRNAPDFLLKDPQIAYGEMKQQIQTWHGHGRQLYAITPRFAITSTVDELEMAGHLKAEYPDVYVHTHLSENKQEIEFTSELFPECMDYLQVYERFGLVGDRSIFAHGIHLSPSELQRLAQAGSAIAHCPTSNLFLGSGLFQLAQAKAAGVKVGLATDVGAGTSFSMLHTMGDAYKVAQLQGENLSAIQAFYLATLGATKALSLEDDLGNFEVGKEADFAVLDWQATPLMALRNPVAAQSLTEVEEILFSLMILGSDRAVTATYVGGEVAIVT